MKVVVLVVVLVVGLEFSPLCLALPLYLCLALPLYLYLQADLSSHPLWERFVFRVLVE